MAKRFTRKPAAKLQALPDEQQVAHFVAGASKREPTTKAKPWEALDPKAKPTIGLNLRLNEYQMTLLRYVAETEDRSIQQTIKRLLIPAAETAAGQSADE